MDAEFLQIYLISGILGSNIPISASSIVLLRINSAKKTEKDGSGKWHSISFRDLLADGVVAPEWIAFMVVVN